MRVLKALTEEVRDLGARYRRTQIVKKKDMLGSFFRKVRVLDKRSRIDEKGER